MTHRRYLQNVLIGVAAALSAAGRFVPAVARDAAALGARAETPASATSAMSDSTLTLGGAISGVATQAKAALGVLASAVRPLSQPQALEEAFRSYFAFKSTHPAEVKKPYLYFVDYGLPSTTPRGYVFDMSSLKVVDGPFTVAHGRGSSKTKYGIPTKFSNAIGSAATSLGLYLTKATYAFRGKTGGRSYSSIGLQLMGVSSGFNDNALARGVVAHGAPYVTPAAAGRSEGCPAMEQYRARQLLPKLADGALVFLFAPNSRWLNEDPWLAQNGN